MLKTTVFPITDGVMCSTLLTCSGVVGCANTCQSYKPDRSGTKLVETSVNDVVLVVDESTSRSLWPLGRVLEVHESRDDGLVWSLKVKTRTSVLTRPIDKVVLLEAADQQ